MSAREVSSGADSLVISLSYENRRSGAFRHLFGPNADALRARALHLQSEHGPAFPCH